MNNRVGQQLGNYRLTQYLGRGAFAETYLGEHVYLGIRAAIKVLQARVTVDEEPNFLNEARTIAHLRHANIIGVLEFGVENTVPYLVMDYAPRGTLRQRYPRDTALPISTIISYVKQVAAGLQYIHEQNLVHRDVKPENLLLGANDEVLLSDFGLAVITQSISLKNSQGIAGTITYMAPEQIQGKPRPVSDQYALGIVVYEWLSGKLPFNGSYVEVAIQQERAIPPSLRDSIPGLSPEIEQVVLTALNKDPAQRFGSVQAFANALEQAYIHSISVNLTTPEPSSLEKIQPALRDEELHVPERIPGTFSQRGILPGKQQSAQNAVLPGSLRPRSNLSRSRLGLLALLALIIIGASVGIIYYVAGVRPANLNAQATAQALTALTARQHNAASATAFAQLTANANASATSLASTATATALRVGYAQAITGNPVFVDALSTNDAHSWDAQSITGTGACRFTGGNYHINIDQLNAYAFCLERSTSFTNFTIQVQMTVVAGDIGGIVFRAHDDGNGNSSLYFFGVGQDGSYAFGTYKSAVQAGSTSNNTTSNTTSNGTADALFAVKRGLNAPNLLTVVAHGSTITFYVNGLLIDRVSDSSFTSGSIGLFAFDNADATEVAFNKIQVWQA